MIINIKIQQLLDTKIGNTYNETILHQIKYLFSKMSQFYIITINITNYLQTGTISSKTIVIGATSNYKYRMCIKMNKWSLYMMYCK